MIGQPIGGFDFSQDDVSEPDRNVDAITSTLIDAENGDILDLTIGTAEAASVVKVYVLNHERDVASFDHRINHIQAPRDDGWTRLYITGIGNDRLDPWEVVSMPYHLDESIADLRDFVGNGWVIDVATDGGSVNGGDRA